MAPHHLIFEGAELCGKSFLMNQVYNVLEKKYNKSGNVLDGCHWFNCDVGIFGTKYGKPCIESYAEMMAKLRDKNLLLEKFYISDKVYNKIYNNTEIDYSDIEKKLKSLDFKIVMIKVAPDPKIFAKRLKDRLNLYPHYKRIAHEPEWYIKQQEEYLKEIGATSLPKLEVDLTEIPNDKTAREILKWIKEN